MTELVCNGREVKAFKNLNPDEALPDALLEVLLRESLKPHGSITAVRIGDFGYKVLIRRDDANAGAYYVLHNMEKA